MDIYRKFCSREVPRRKRVSPDDAVNMPKIVTPGVASDFAINSGANHWRLAGLELTAASDFPKGCPQPGVNCMTYNLVGMQSNPATEPDSITIDRCYIHGSPTQDLQDGVQMNGSNFAVVDSYISEVHIKGFDSQALLAYWTPGPLKITNNYISAAGENIMFGGAGGPTTPWVPSDIQVQNNYIFKPLSWVPLSLPPVRSMVVKNAFEIKSAQRVLFRQQHHRECLGGWTGGAAVVLTVRSSQSGDVAVVNDISITNNVLKNVVAGFATLAKDYMCGVAPYTNCHNAGSQDRWNISNNLILFYDPTILGGGRNIALTFSGGKDRPRRGHRRHSRRCVPAQHYRAGGFDALLGLDLLRSGPRNKASVQRDHQQHLAPGQCLCRPPTATGAGRALRSIWGDEWVIAESEYEVPW